MLGKVNDKCGNGGRVMNKKLLERVKREPQVRRGAGVKGTLEAQDCAGAKPAARDCYYY